MSMPNVPSEPSPSNLQFDEAEFVAETPAHPTCATCDSPISDRYYENSGRIYCERCREQIEAAFHGGSRLGRGVKALILGSIAAAVGSVVYYGITHATGWNIGLVAVVLGVMIGGAVKAGSGNRGGWFYQLLALVLTYTAITAMHVPDIIEGFREQARQEEQEIEELFKQATDGKAIALKNIDGKDQLVAEESQEAKEIFEKLDQDRAKQSEADKEQAASALAEGPVEQEKNEPLKQADEEVIGDEPVEIRFLEAPAMTTAEWLLAIVTLVGLVFAFPVILAINSPISGLIYGFALWEACKINKKEQLAFNGPYSLEAQGHTEPEGEDAADGGD